MLIRGNVSPDRRASKSHPPVPPHVFRVGITGHRPNRLTLVDPDLLAKQIHAVLQAVSAAAHDAAVDVHLVLITSLAEGADRLAAHAGRALQFALHVPLPMPADLYVSDFQGEHSIGEFYTLLSAAKRIFVLPPPEGEDRSSCYAAASNLMLNQCDLLLVISDDGPSGGPGGAADTCRIAEDRGLLTVRVAATPGAGISFRGDAKPLTALTAAVQRILCPSGALRQQLDLYRQESWHTRSPAAAYAMLRFVAEFRFTMPPRQLLDTPVLQIQSTKLQPYFHWADTLAMFYGERSRTASLRVQVLATTSVIAALLDTAFAAYRVVPRVLGTAEALLLLWLLASVRRFRTGSWHDRWLRYRSIAEQLRCVDILAPLGLSSLQPDPEPDEHPSGTALMPWLVRRIEAEEGFPDGTVDSSYLDAHVRHLEVVLRDQASFHAAAARRYQAAERTFHRCGMVLFCAAALLAVYDLLHALVPGGFAVLMQQHPWAEATASALAAALPALGAAAVAIVAQGEYKRLAERSNSMQISLHRIATRLASLGTDRSLGSVSNSCLNAAQVLSSEVRDWSDMLASRPPSLPV